MSKKLIKKVVFIISIIAILLALFLPSENMFYKENGLNANQNKLI